MGKCSRWILGFRNLALFLDLLDDSYANCCSHVTNGESSKFRNVLEVFKNHWSERSHLDESAVADFEERHEDYLVSVLQYSSLDPSYRDSPDSGYGVDVLDWNSQWLVERLGRWNNSVESIKYAWTLVPWSIGALLCKVVSQPSAGGNEINLGNIIANRLQQSFQFLPGLLVTLLSVLDRLIIHLVDSYN